MAVMYGMMPMAKMETCSRAPPLNRFTNWYSPPVVLPAARHCWTLRVVHTGGRDIDTHAVDRDDGEREQQLASQVRRPEYPGNGAEQASS